MGQKISILSAKIQSVKDQGKRKLIQDKDANGSKVTIEKLQVELQNELKQLSEANFQREQEDKKVIAIIQEQAKESSLLVKGLRADLEDAQHKIDIFDNRVHQLETQLLEEQQTSASLKKKGEELEIEIRRVRKQLETEIDLQRVNKELEDEKAAREEAWAKISALEQEMNAALRDLDNERHRLKVASEKILLVEAHLREFHSTTEEMKNLFSKQQEHVKEMQRTLMEDHEENHKKTSVEVDPSQISEETHTTGNPRNKSMQSSFTSSTKMEPGKNEEEEEEEVETSSDSIAEKEAKAPMLVLQMTGI